MIFLPKMRPNSADMGPADPVVRPAHESRLSSLSRHYQVGSQLVYVGAGSLYVSFLCQMGPSCKCNAGCNLLWFHLHILRVFILFPTCVPAIR